MQPHLPTINIILSANKEFVEPMCALINSIVVNTDRRVNIYICHIRLNNCTCKRIIRIFSKFDNLNINFLKFDKRIFNGYPTSRFYTTEMYLYLFALYKIDAPKALCLDSDIIVNGDISCLYDIDISDFILAATPDISFKDKVNRLTSLGYETKKYHNSGVLLFNVGCLKQHIQQEDILSFLLEAKTETLHYPDQDLINIIVPDSQCLTLNRDKYNQMLLGHGWSSKFLDNALIIHYAGNQKPWRAFNGVLQKIYIDLYWKNAKACGFRKFPSYYLCGIRNKLPH